MALETRSAQAFWPLYFLKPLTFILYPDLWPTMIFKLRYGLEDFPKYR